MANAREGHEFEQGVDKAQPCAQDRYEAELLPHERRSLHAHEGSLDLAVLQGQISGGLIKHQQADLVQQLPELPTLGCFAPHQR